jgi:putative phosphoesterase
MPSGDLVLGVISDTHGLVRPEALAALVGVDRIFHAGDVGGRAVIDALAEVAPVTVVRGNNDRDAWGLTLPATVTLTLAGRTIHMLHDRNDLDPRLTGLDVVITGHSHKPSQQRIGGTLYLNPGSAGPRRFKLPITLALLRLGADIGAELIDLVR